MNPPVHPEDIKAQLRKRYGSVFKFEDAKNLSRRTVSQVLGGRAVLATAEAIADELDIPLYRVSLHYHRQYYNLSTTPRHRRDDGAMHRQNAGAR